jgi:D-beta-D-heptose 7-phosphate kinase/D-beta-D-heptose 1-phosphate adenosyltransferase
VNLDFSNLRILVYGDVMLDEYVHGVIERISPEAPVPVLRETNCEYRAGGAANVAANVAALGAQVTLVAPVAADQRGDILWKVVADSVKTHFVTASSVTTRKTRFVAQRGHYALRVDQDGELTNEAAVVKTLDWITSGFDAIIVSDYAKGAVTLGTMQALRAKCVPIFVDPKQSDWSLYSGALYFTPNEKEWGDAMACRVSGALGVLITRAERGMSFMSCGMTTTTCPAVAQAVADVTGAGDTVIAAFTCAVTASNDPVDAMRFANAAAGVAVSKSGTAAVTIAEARAAFGEPKMCVFPNCDCQPTGMTDGTRAYCRQYGLLPGGAFGKPTACSFPDCACSLEDAQICPLPKPTRDSTRPLA